MSAKDVFDDVCIERGYHNTSAKLGLGLQGGAAHGAFTWGVLDRLLEEDDIEIGAISGASSGAFNTALVADGLAVGDRQRAKDKLRLGWMMLSKAADDLPKSLGIHVSPFRSLQLPIVTPFGLSYINYDKIMGTWPNLCHPLHQFYMQQRSNIPQSVYQKAGANPIHDIVDEIVDFGAIQKSDLKVFVGALNGRTQKHTIFTGEALTAKAVGASANIRFMMPPIILDDGDEYWDGGFFYNPYFDPLANHCPDITDIKAVMLNPVDQNEEFTTAARAQERLDASVFSGAAYENLGKIAVMNSILEDLKAVGVNCDDIERLNKRIILIHRLQMHVSSELGASSKFNLDPDHLENLRGRGYKAEDEWLRQHKNYIGWQSTFDAKNFARADYRGLNTVRAKGPVMP